MSAEQAHEPVGSPLELESSTLDEIVDALSSCRPISLPQNAGDFLLNSEDARVAFRFYASRRDLWPQQKQLSSKEVDDLLQALETPKAAIRRAQVVAPSLKRPRWRIAQVRAHRFAGLHRHCDANGQAPDLLTLDLDRDVTCIWGFNGAGKTAFQSAIMWCLTGQAHRSQHKPIEVHEPIAVEVLSESDVDGATSSDSARSLSLPPIVPLPSAADLAAIGDKPASDTWVELTLRESAGQELVVRRELRRSTKGALSVHTIGIEDLGLPQWAIEAGTLMPALAATMRFDEKTTFADAIAQLTGLKPLEDLGKRSDRLARRLSGEESTRSAEDKASALARYSTSKRTFGEAWEAQLETIGEAPELLSPESEVADKSCKAVIQTSKLRLEQLRDRGQKDIEDILGTVPPLEAKEQVVSFVDVLRDARERLGAVVIATLPSIDTVKRLGQIQADDRTTLRAKLQDLSRRAATQVARLKNKKEAARWQLYTMVASWHRGHHPDKPMNDCPVCGTDLTQVPPDALLDREVAEALKLSAQADADAAKTLQDWQRDTASELLESLPHSLRSFVDTKPPTSLLGLYRDAYVSELFNHTAFKSQLRPLKENAAAVWDLATQTHALADSTSPDVIDLPQELKTSMLASRFANLQAALVLSEHRELSEVQLKAIGQRYFGSGQFNRSDIAQENQDVSRLPLRHQIVALQQAVDSSQPILALLRQLNELETIRQAWAKANKRHKLLQRAAEAVQQFASFPALVHHQVEGLLQVLDARTKAWLDMIYRPHYVGGPSYLGLDPSRTHGVGLYAGLGQLRVHAHEVMNLSQLRACVWAFVFSLWERIRDRAGVLDVLLLDDPQTYFDPINIENLAAAIPSLVQAGMRPIVTSNDARFLAAVKDKLPRVSSGSPSWTMLQISPISSSRLTAALTPAVEEVFERRDVWRADEGDVAKAQAFVERVRIHIENRLWDLLAADPLLMYKPTLADLVGHIANARNGGEKPFNEIPFERLLGSKSLRTGSSFYSIINQAHHNLRNVTPHDANEVDTAFDEVDRLLRSCSASYARFMGRLTREDEDLFFAIPPPPPLAISLNKSAIQVLGDFSARTYADAIAVEDGLKTFSFDELGDVALFAIRGSSLGALALPGQVVAASLSGQAKSGDPVIALFESKVLARRYHADQSDLSRVTLACDQSGTENVAPAITLPRSKVRILPIVGIFYDSAPCAGSNEACLVESCVVLDKARIAARIIEDSGYPVVRNGDLVLLEKIQTPTGAMLNRMKGHMVAFVASRHGEQYAYLKRIGSSIQGNLRLFENVGTFGDSLAVFCSEEGHDGNAGDVLTLQSMWCVHGVIRAAF